MAADNDYHVQVTRIESGLSPYAKRSFESFSPVFIDGTEVHASYAALWKDNVRRSRLTNRTPLQIERDRIVYSNASRKLTEKYHVIYSGRRRIIRNYVTHVMRLVQVSRALCRGLALNGDFAEAIALGSKVGALPFIHASKRSVSEWVRRRLRGIDDDWAKNEPPADTRQRQLTLDFGQAAIPSWIAQLRSPSILQRVLQYLPWAAGLDTDCTYSTGQQGYWLLCLNPYTFEATSHSFCRETMYGIWRHTLGTPLGRNSFHHHYEVPQAVIRRSAPAAVIHDMAWSDATYEQLVVAYADDITWTIENLNDANSAALLNGRQGTFESLVPWLGQDAPDALVKALALSDASALYNYFINDFVTSAGGIITRLGEGANQRAALREGAQEAAVHLSDDGEAALAGIKRFLEAVVFSEPRVSNRNRMLMTLSEACMDLLYEGADDILPRYIRDKATLFRWSDDQCRVALELAKDPIHRLQLAVDVFVDMGDQEIFDFVGIDSL